MILSNRLKHERLLFESCWSPITAHPETEYNKINISAGQCFVTTLYLYNYLKNLSLKETLFTINRGKILDSNKNILIKDHCWLEVHKSNKTLIIDLTADQSEYIDNKVICKYEEDIFSELQLIYSTSKIYLEEDLMCLDNLTQKRYSLLLNSRLKY